MELNDKITLSLPCKAEYVSVARLTASGIAYRMGFDIDTVEDIKVAVSEVCSRLINVSRNNSGEYEIFYEINDNKLKVTFSSKIERAGCIFEDDEEGLGVAIIKAFMDEVEFCPDNKDYILSMTKYIEEKS
ncbi:MAG TPA: ATP-binding protein [Clostridiales bacterium]|nr:ATP-binding protein [Clostridiales bacterium]HPP36483.1 ATP-binding protein [Clostridiales bacterium]